MDDLKIFEGIKAGSTKALETLVNKYSNYITAIVSSIGNTHFTQQDTEEITADCFISFWKNASAFVMKTECLKSYLAATARNKSINVLNSRKIEHLPLNEDVLFDEQGVEDDYAKRETEQSIKTCVMEFSEPDKSIFVLRYYYFFKTSEIAKELKLSQKAVEARLIRGREKLKTKLIERGLANEDTFIGYNR